LLNQVITNTDSFPMTINIPNADNYKYVMIVFRGDYSNGSPYIVSKEFYNIEIPFYATSRNAEFIEDGSGYAFYAQGSIINNNITIRYLKVNGWSSIKVIAYGAK